MVALSAVVGCGRLRRCLSVNCVESEYSIMGMKVLRVIPVVDLEYFQSWKPSSSSHAWHPRESE